MEIIVEVGTQQQRELIHQELSVLKLITDSLTNIPAITKVVVPANFDEAVNSLQNTNHYKSERGNLAVAKNIPQENGVALVFPPLLYTDGHDNQTRMQIYTHEFFHVVSKTLFPEIPNNSLADFIYFSNIYTLFDEYYANRKSYQVTEDIYKDLSYRYRKNNAIHLKGFIKSVLEECDYYKKIRREISKFRFHANVETFLKNSDNSFDAAAKSLVSDLRISGDSITIPFRRPAVNLYLGISLLSHSVPGRVFLS